MMHLHAEEWYSVAGLGDVACVKMPVAVADPYTDFKGSVVDIDGKQYTALRYETWANGTMHGPWAKGREVGVMVGAR